MSDRTINLSRWTSKPTATEINDAMVFVSETLGERWTAVRRGVEYVFTGPTGGIIRSSRRDFRAAVQDATGLVVTR